MKIDIPNTPTLSNRQHTLLRDKTFSSLSLPLTDLVRQVQSNISGGLKVPLKLDPKNSVQVLRAGAVFGEILSTASRLELLKLAEGGDVDARDAVNEAFGNRAIYPGTFDPFTFGHVDVARRAAKLFGQVVIAIGVNPGKSPLFSVDERIALIKEELKDLGDKVQVLSFEGSLVGLARRLNCDVVLRGIRSVTDYEQELQLALVNLTLSKGSVETLFMPAKEGASFVSSSVVKNVVKIGEDASSMVSSAILQAIHAKHREGALK